MSPQPIRTSLGVGAVRVVFGAVLGAVVCMVVLRLLDFIIQAISVEVGAIGKLLWELIWALPSSIRDAFSTPWGAVGAALGGDSPGGDFAPVRRMIFGLTITQS